MRIVPLVAVISMGAGNLAFAGEKFDRITNAFQNAKKLQAGSLSGDHAWAGFCVTSDDDVADALLAYRQSNDPVMGQTVKALAIQLDGSSNYFVRLDEAGTRKEIDKATPGEWNDGSYNDDELFTRIHWRFQTILRQTNGADSYMVALRQCQSLDRRECNGSGSSPFITYEACYYYSQKF